VAGNVSEGMNAPEVPTFTDMAGRDWRLVMSIADLRAVRDRLGVDLNRLDSESLLTRLYTDPVFLCDVLYVLCAQQAEVVGVSDEEFGRALGGDALEAATGALLDALVNFFPSGKRTTLRRILNTMDRIDEMGQEKATEMLDNGTLEKAMAGILASGSASTASPESSASTPAPIASES